MLILSSFESSNRELCRGPSYFSGYLRGMSCWPIGLSRIFQLFLGVELHHKDSPNFLAILLFHWIKQSQLYFFVKRTGILTYLLPPCVLKFLSCSDPSLINSYSVCIALENGNSISKKNECFLVKMSLEPGMYRQYIPSRECKTIPISLGRPISLSFRDPCLGAYETQPEIPISEVFVHSSTRFLRSFYVNDWVTVR